VLRAEDRLRRGIAALAAVLIAAVGAPAAASAASSTHGLGLLIKPPAPVSSAEVQEVKADAIDAPASVDLTPYAMPVGNQGSVGSCAAWATDYAAMGYWENRQGIDGGGLAPMYTYSQLVGGRNVGTYINSHLEIAKSQGVDVQTDYSFGNYDYVHTPTSAQRINAAHWVLTSYDNLPIVQSATSTVTQLSIKGALAAGNPVVLAIPVYSNFFGVGTAEGGYYSGPSGSLAGWHAIAALGYTSSGVRIQNSWGTSWGDHGFATLSWAFVNKYVGQAVSVGRLVAGDAPTSLNAPSVPAPSVGKAVTASPGTWTGSPTSFTYGWQRLGLGSSSWTSIDGATSQSYTPVVGDAGAKLRVVVTATNDKGSTDVVSAASAAVKVTAPINTKLPAVSGRAARGETLSASNGSWLGDPKSFAYQWQRAGGNGVWVNVPGAVTAKYLVQKADVNGRLRVVVTARNAANAAGSAISEGVGPATASPPVNTAAPALLGRPVKAVAFVGSTGRWTGIGNTYAYQWQRNTGAGFVDIPMATKSSYIPVTADVGARLRLKVTATNPDATVIAYSAGTDAVTATR
jgi:hypothetical protein